MPSDGAAARGRAPGRTGRGRPRHFDEQEALGTAMRLFWERGYTRTTLDDVVRATGAARASVYRTFGDKRSLFTRALDRYATGFESRVDAALDAHADAREALAGLLRDSAARLLDPDQPDGCLRCSATLELAGIDPDIDRAIGDTNRRYELGIQRIVDAGIERGQLEPADAVGLAGFVTGCVAGMVVLAAGGADAAALDAFVARTLDAWISSTPPQGD